jgi:membrane protease YdiL (CAAX protease family)
MSKENTGLVSFRHRPPDSSPLPMEAMILYFVLFFPGIYASGLSLGADTIEIIPFLPFSELARTLTYTLPSIALIWYIIGKKKLLALISRRFRKKDLIAFAIGLCGLILISLIISFLVSIFLHYFDFIPAPPKVEAPVNYVGWIILVFSCLGTGYLEESFFRYYLITKYESSFPQTAARVVISTFMFSLCHVYEGPGGFINAILAGILLSALFIRYKSLHGIAWAHSAYNIFVYVMGIFGS